MVFFSCDGCAEMLKKSQVDQHAYRCRNCYAVSCVDCNVSFPGDEYRKHTSCMTESERYEKGDAKRGNKKHKLTPQQAWTALIQSSIETAPSHLQHHMTTISNLDNIPRKEKQFINFAKNSLRGVNNTVVTDIWNHFQKVRKEQQQQQEQSKPQQSTTPNKTDPEPKNQISDDSDDNDSKDIVQEQADENANHDKDDKNQHSTDAEMQETATTKNIEKESKSNTTKEKVPNKKSVKKAMKSVLKKSAKLTLSTKKLQKAVRKYLNCDKEHKKVIKTIVKDVIKNDQEQYVLDGDKISLRK